MTLFILDNSDSLAISPSTYLATASPRDKRVLSGTSQLNFLFEDDLRDTDGYAFPPMRKINPKRPLPPWVRYLQQQHRTMIETTGSLISQRFPKSTHAVTAVGFELKVVLFVLSFSIDRLQVAT